MESISVAGIEARFERSQKSKLKAAGARRKTPPYYRARNGYTVPQTLSGRLSLLPAEGPEMTVADEFAALFVPQAEGE